MALGRVQPANDSRPELELAVAAAPALCLVGASLG
eukprot:COSAG01_NODE_63547_length_279_cov_1.316667_1_plen_34_part_10